MLPESVDAKLILEPGTTTVELTELNRLLRADTSVATDANGQEHGRTVSVYDITDERRRQQRIQVLNRVLRHNLRNDMGAVNSFAEHLEENTNDPGDYAIRIQEMAAELISIGEKAREIEEVVAAEQAERAGQLGEVIKQAVGEVRAEFEDCEIRTELPTESPTVNSLVLTSVLRELIENACRHNDAENPIVEVEAQVNQSTEYPIQISVSDNGPGIPNHELGPLEEGTETALEHGSSLGLWLVEWGVTKLNGKIEFEQNEPRGTIVSLQLPLIN